MINNATHIYEERTKKSNDEICRISSASQTRIIIIIIIFAEKKSDSNDDVNRNPRIAPTILARTLLCTLHIGDD